MITILEMNLAPLNRWQLVFITISSLLLIFNFLFYLGVLERTKLPLLHTHACTSTDLLDRAVRLSDCLAQAQQDVSLQKHGHFAQAQENSADARASRVHVTVASSSPARAGEQRAAARLDAPHRRPRCPRRPKLSLLPSSASCAAPACRAAPCALLTAPPTAAPAAAARQAERMEGTVRTHGRRGQRVL